LPDPEGEEGVLEEGGGGGGEGVKRSSHKAVNGIRPAQDSLDNSA